MIIYVGAVVAFVLIIFISRNIFLFPYIYVIGILTEDLPIVYIITITLGNYLSPFKIIMIILSCAFLISKKPKINFLKSKTMVSSMFFFIFFSFSIIWLEQPLEEKGRLLSFPLIGITTWICCLLCTDHRYKMHFIKAVSIGGMLLSIASLLIFFDIEIRTFGGNYVQFDERLSTVFRSRPFNLNSNIASFWISLCTMPTLSFFIYKQRLWKRLPYKVNIYFVILNLMALMTIASISSFISVIVMLITTIYFSTINTNIKIKVVVSLVSVFITFLIISIPIGLFDNVYMRIAERENEEYRASVYEDISALGGREALFSQAISSFINSPAIGNGLTSFKSTYGKSNHSSYLWALTEGGIIGFILWISILILFFIESKNFRSKLNRNIIQSVISTTFIAIVIGSLIYSSAHNIHFNKFFWLCLAISSGHYLTLGRQN